MSDFMALRFNARALSENSKLKMVHNKWYGWHLQTCIRVCDCICNKLLNDPGCIFDDTSTIISAEESLNHFNYLSWKREEEFDRNGNLTLTVRPRKYKIDDDGHLFNCINGKLNEHFRDNQQYDCACAMVIKNPERFFKIPLSDWCKSPIPKEIQTL